MAGNTPAKIDPRNSPTAFVKDLNVQKMITERLGKRSGQFTTSLLSLINSNAKIAECKPITVVQAALTAASMDLPINQNLGFAYIVPYKNRGVMEAQFQMGWKGFVQLAQRSGSFEKIDSCLVYEGDDDESVMERLTKIMPPEPPSDKVVGYAGYFKLLNGFSKIIYMTKIQIEAHAGRYSQAYKNRGGSFKSPWETDFDLMAQKTVIKQLLSKYAPLSTEMQEAVSADQSVADENGRRYVDGEVLEDEVKATDEKKSAILAANQKGEDDNDTPGRAGK